jgi:AcrR family transcriptional regulator
LTDRRRQRHLETRREILDHAWKIARSDGLAALSLTELARRMQMRTPSLYTYFESKNAVYDAMFAEAAAESLELLRSFDPPTDPLDGFNAILTAFFDFCVADPARYQLLFQRTIPGFEPSPAAYAPAVTFLELATQYLARFGINEPRHIDMVSAMITGFADQQIANDPGGTRWRDLLDEAFTGLYNHVLTAAPKGLR